MQFQARYYITPELWELFAPSRDELCLSVWRVMKGAGAIPDTAVWSGMEGDFFVGYIMQARWNA